MSRDFIDSHIIEKLSEYVFSDTYVGRIAQEYNDYLKAQCGDSITKAKFYQSKLRSLDHDINNVADLLIKTKSVALIQKLNILEDEKRDTEKDVNRMKDESRITEVTEDEIREAFQKIREKLISGGMENVRKIIEAYVDKVVVYPDKIGIYFNFIPFITLYDNEKKECNELQSPPNTLGFSAENGGEGEVHFSGVKYQYLILWIGHIRIQQIKFNHAKSFLKQFRNYNLN